MINNKTIRLFFAVGFQLAVLASLILFNVSVLGGGEEVLLQIQPFDPRDLLRGDYATFRYKISNLDANLLDGAGVRNGYIVYVGLAPNGKFWEATRIYTKRPQDGVFLRGIVTSGNFMENRDIQSGNLQIEYGIEQYFIPEGQGRDMDFRGENNYAAVAIDGSGNAVIKKIYINDKSWP